MSKALTCLILAVALVLAASPEATATPFNTVCPVMGGPVNPDISVECQGQRVLFCCGGCPRAFQANPERYLSELPQFRQQQAETVAAPESTPTP